MGRRTCERASAVALAALMPFQHEVKRKEKNEVNETEENRPRTRGDPYKLSVRYTLWTQVRALSVSRAHWLATDSLQAAVLPRVAAGG